MSELNHEGNHEKDTTKKIYTVYCIYYVCILVAGTIAPLLLCPHKTSPPCPVGAGVGVWSRTSPSHPATHSPEKVRKIHLNPKRFMT